MSQVSEMIELIMYEAYHNAQEPSDADIKVMCARGLFMLLQIEHLSDYAWLKISFEIIQSIN